MQTNTALLPAMNVLALRASLEANFPGSLFTIETLDTGELLVRYRGLADPKEVEHFVFARTDAAYRVVLLGLA